jgi:hypothetical protein
MVTRAAGMAASLASLILPEIVLFPLCPSAIDAKTTIPKAPNGILYFIDRE